MRQALAVLAMDKESTCRFHLNRVIKGRVETLTEWRVTTDQPQIAARVSQLLGGWMRPHDGAWEVLTESSCVRIMVEQVTEIAIRFRLADDPDLGAFRFTICWTWEEIMGGAQQEFHWKDGPMLGELSIVPVEFKTLNALHVRYLLPRLGFLADENSSVPPGSGLCANSRLPLDDRAP